MSWYCDIAPADPLHASYHDQEYGFPVVDEGRLFERLALEIFQAGLSWRLVLSKRPRLVDAFDGFVVDRVADYDEGQLARLLADDGIIRNRRKLAAIIENAVIIRDLRASHGGFAAWLAGHHPNGEDAWLQTFRATFRFVGREVVREFLLSTGFLPGAHRPECPIYPQIVESAPPWLAARGAAPNSAP